MCRETVKNNVISVVIISLLLLSIVHDVLGRYYIPSDHETKTNEMHEILINMEENGLDVYIAD